MAERLFRRFGPGYILVMMLLTRLAGTAGGLLVIYYVELTLDMPDVIRTHFRISAGVVVVIGCTLTVLLAMWETRHLRDVLGRLRDGVAVDEGLLSRAGREAMTFLARHHWHEAWLVPSSTLVPVLVYLWQFDAASATLLENITIAVFMGIAMALMSTFFAVEHCMQPVIRRLLECGAAVDYPSLPAGRLRFRFRLCFTLIIMTTSLMIGTLARQRAADILQEKNHENAARAVAALKAHSSYITVAAVVVGAVFSTLLANSVAFRARDLVGAMERVAGGNLAERVRPTGNDEIDVLARQFNAMVETLQHNDHTIRDLNANLERKVGERTRQLEVTLTDLQEMQTQLTDAAHRAGMAEIATGVLHNVGNVLNSVNVSTTLVGERLRKSKMDDLARLNARLAGHRDDLAGFLAGDRGTKFVEYLASLTAKLAEEREGLRDEIESLTEKVGHIRGIIGAQQGFARRIRFREQVDLARLVQDVLDMHREALARHGISVVTRLEDVGPAYLEKTKLVPVLDNLVKNAVEAMSEGGRSGRSLTVSLEPHRDDRVRLTVADTGHGIRPEHLTSMFRYGFTTKAQGNGFGLHSCALAMSALGGTIRARSEGEGRGAAFVLEFPLTQGDEPVGSGMSAATDTVTYALSAGVLEAATAEDAEDAEDIETATGVT